MKKRCADFIWHWHTNLIKISKKGSSGVGVFVDPFAWLHRCCSNRWFFLTTVRKSWSWRRSTTHGVTVVCGMRSCVTDVLVIPSSCFANHSSGHWDILAAAFTPPAITESPFSPAAGSNWRQRGDENYLGDSFCRGFLLGYAGPQNTVLSLEKQELNWKTKMQICNAAKLQEDKDTFLKTCQKSK